MDYETSAENFLSIIRVRYENWCSTHGMHQFMDRFQIESGRKYDKIVSLNESGGRSAFGFIEKSTGDIFKAASWAVPAKHPRGNIYTNPESALEQNSYFIRYLR